VTSRAASIRTARARVNKAQVPQVSRVYKIGLAQVRFH